MKKIICLLLILCCTFAVCSCNKKEPKGVAKIASIVESSNPTRITTFSDYYLASETDAATLKGRYFTSIMEDGTKKFEFKYDRFAAVGLDSAIETVTGSVLYNADGSVSEDDGATWTGSGTGYLPYSLVIDESCFDSFTVSEDGNTLSAVISANKAERVFGTKISAEGTILLEVETDGRYLYYVNVSYSTANASVTINTSYDYSVESNND